MTYRTRLEDACSEIEAAQIAVAKAAESYSRGGSLNALNKANRALADAHASYRETSGGRVPDCR